MGDYRLVKNPEQEIRRDNSMAIPKINTQKKRQAFQMKIVNNYTDKISDLISGNTEYEIPLGLTTTNYTPSVFERTEIVLNVLTTGGTFQSSFTL